MIPNKYIITFVTGFEKTIYAFSEEQAKILAQAEAIKEAKDHQVLFIEKIDHPTKYTC